MIQHRPIKFRIRNTKTNQWIHGPNKVSSLDGVNLFGETILFGTLMNGVSLEELNDCVALQFTGLLDKNGKEIFEGDIVKFQFTMFGIKESINLVIEFRKGSFEAMMPESEEPSLPMSFHGALFDCAVVGNIYDNPELLKISA
jgi:uncharacterized phage protein (TIGR01671 family)